MTNSSDTHNRSILQRVARQAMFDRGLLPDFSHGALAELDCIHGPAPSGIAIRDLRTLLWCSIDNDDSRDLDQLSVAESMNNGNVKILIAVADVDSLVKKQSAIDEHARHNTTSVYTAARIFPLLPEKLSTDFTSLNFESDRNALVIEMVFTDNGLLQTSDLYRAMVRNHAKLAYDSVDGWLAGNGETPKEIAAVAGLEENLRLQDRTAHKLKALRHVNGALDFETIEPRPVFDGDELKDLAVDARNRAKEIIEDFMIAANGVTARFLAAKQLPSIRRVVRTPKRWDRIVELASLHEFTLPREPDPKTLEHFLTKAKQDDPLRFPDLSLSIIKLLGPGEYIVELPGKEIAGHFGLAVKEYTHATAPNRRFPDLITQRLLKTAIAGQPPAYTAEELNTLARHCTEMEDAAKKVERLVIKSAAAMLLESRIGERFDAIVTGASDKGTWVRLSRPPIEGRLVSGYKGMDVGHRLTVKLVSTNVEKGFIDFETDSEGNVVGIVDTSK